MTVSVETGSFSTRIAPRVAGGRVADDADAFERERRTVAVDGAGLVAGAVVVDQRVGDCGGARGTCHSNGTAATDEATVAGDRRVAHDQVGVVDRVHSTDAARAVDCSGEDAVRMARSPVAYTAPPDELALPSRRIQLPPSRVSEPSVARLAHVLEVGRATSFERDAGDRHRPPPVRSKCRLADLRPSSGDPGRVRAEDRERATGRTFSVKFAKSSIVAPKTGLAKFTTASEPSSSWFCASPSAARSVQAPCRCRSAVAGSHVGRVTRGVDDPPPRPRRAGDRGGCGSDRPHRSDQSECTDVLNRRPRPLTQRSCDPTYDSPHP